MSLKQVLRKDGQLLEVGDLIRFLEDGGMFKKGEIAEILEFNDKGTFFYYVGNLALSVEDPRYEIL